MQAIRKKDKIKTLFFPYKSGNPYIDIIKSCLIEAGYSISAITDLEYRLKRDRQYKIINLNWFDSIGTCSTQKAIGLLIRQTLRVFYYKLCGMKVIYTLHNNQAHDTNHPIINAFLMRYLCHTADRIVGLCSHTRVVLKEYLSEQEIENKLRIMYAPSYEGVYERGTKNIYRDKSKLKILFLGMVRPYKNIELILEIAETYRDANVEFMIAGEPVSQEYENRVRKLGDHLNNVILELHHIQDKDITAYYDWCDIVLLPMSLKSSLNSGSAVLAFTMKKTVIAPKIGTLMDFPETLLFSYSYSDENDHKSRLKETVDSVYNLWLKNQDVISRMGIDINLFLNKNYSKEMTVERYKSLYSELLDQ